MDFTKILSDVEQAVSGAVADLKAAVVADPIGASKSGATGVFEKMSAFALSIAAEIKASLALIGAPTPLDLGDPNAPGADERTTQEETD